MCPRILQWVQIGLSLRCLFVEVFLELFAETARAMAEELTTVGEIEAMALYCSSWRRRKKARDMEGVGSMRSSCVRVWAYIRLIESHKKNHKIRYVWRKSATSWIPPHRQFPQVQADRYEFNSSVRVLNLVKYMLTDSWFWDRVVSDLFMWKMRGAIFRWNRSLRSSQMLLVESTKRMLA